MASLSINPPENLSNNGKLSDNWRQWKQNFEIYLRAAGIDPNDEKVCPLFLHCIGQHGRNIFNNLSISEPYTLKYFYTKFDQFCNPKANLVFERYTFFNTRQGNQSFDKFYSLLKQKSLNCEFGELTDSLIGTQIIIGINDVALRKRLLAVPDLTLKDIVEACRSSEAAKLTMQKMESLTPSKSANKSQNAIKQSTINPNTVEQLAQKLGSSLTQILESNVQINDKKGNTAWTNKEEVKEKPAKLTVQKMESLKPSTSAKKRQNAVKQSTISPSIVEQLAQKLGSSLTQILESNVQINDKKGNTAWANKEEVKEKPAVVNNCKFCSGTHKYGNCPKRNTVPCKSGGKSNKKGKCAEKGNF